MAAERRLRVTGHEKVRDQDYLDVEGEEVEGVDVSGLKLRGFSGIGSRFTGCSFEKVKIGDAAFGAGREQFARLYDKRLLEDLSALLAAGDEGG